MDHLISQIKYPLKVSSVSTAKYYKLGEPSSCPCGLQLFPKTLKAKKVCEVRILQLGARSHE